MAKTTVPQELSSTPNITDNGTATAITIDSSQNVGIGTSSPATNLDGASGLSIEGSTSGGVAVGCSSHAYLMYTTTSTNALSFWDSTNNLERMRIDSSGNVGINVASPSSKLHVQNDSGGSGGYLKVTDVTYGGDVRFGMGDGIDNSAIAGTWTNNSFLFYTNSTERLRIDSDGHAIFGKTSNSFSTAGTTIYGDATYNGTIEAVVDGNTCVNLNRLTSDGDILNFYQNSTYEGGISVSGTTVSYNGGHLARWTQMDSDNGGLLKGTVMTNLDDMCVWKQAVFTTQHLVSPAVEAVEAVAEIPEELDDEGNVIQEYVPAVEAVEAQDAVYEDVEQRETYEGDAADGDVIDFEFEGQTYSATVVFEDNEQLNKMEVSSVEGDANVAGVFVAYDDDGDITIAMTGDMVIRVAQGTTVARGDLLMSAGDGTAKPQDDDIVRAKTIAKVTSTHVSHTYDDGSYLVPCVLMAC